MNRLLIAVLVVCSISISALAGGNKYYSAPYYQQSDFMNMTPGSIGNSAGALFNPAAWGVVNSPEIQFLWDDADVDLGETHNWTLLTGNKGLGFAVQQWEYSYARDPDGKRKLTDYHIGMGGGDEAFNFGLGYTWSRGEASPGFLRDNILSYGVLSRPCKYVSMGFAGHFPLKKNGEHRSVADIGIRPLGTKMITLFSDATMWSDQSPKNIQWGAGLAIQPLSGISISGKLIHGGGFMAGVSLSGLMFTTHFDRDNERTYNSYGVRVGLDHQGHKGHNIVDKFKDKGSNYQTIKFDNAIKYQRYRYFDTGGHTLMELLKTIEVAKDDPTVDGLKLIITEDMYGSAEMIWEVREKLKEFKSSGKKVVVWFERGSMIQYYFASVADKIMVDPQTTVSMMGFNAGRTYYKNMLDKMGIGVDEWRFFEYKSAFESLSRTSATEADKQQRKELIDGFYDILRADVCESRGISIDDFDHVVNNVAFLNADSLMAYKLVDTIGRKDDMDDFIKNIDKEKKSSMVSIKIGKSKYDKDIWGIPPRIAVIYALGPCSMNDGINARRLEGVIKHAREDKSIKAVVLRADSPGGDILPSDIVALELKKTSEKKPVIISQGAVAASGGYWISMYGDTIVASPWTVTGSIGVIGGWLYNNGFGDKIGLTYDHTQIGDHADLGYGVVLPFIGATIPDRNLTTSERALIERNIRNWYDNFLKQVSAGREMDKEEVHKIAQGRVWTGTAGLNNGLVDSLGGIELAIRIARDAANLPDNQYVEILEMPDLGAFDPSMFMPKLLGIKVPQSATEPYELKYYKQMLKAKGQPFLMLPPEYYLEVTSGQ